MGVIGASSRASDKNPNLQWLEVKSTVSNRKRFLAFAEAMKPAAGTADAFSYVGLVGGVDPMSFRLRVAQSHLRNDLTPSKWSHAFLVAAPAFGDDPPIVETSLDPDDGFGKFNMPTTNNGIQYATLRRYDSARRFPNVALIQLPCALSAVLACVDELSRQRGVFDVSAAVLKWLAFCWGTEGAPNPILSGVGIPSAAVLETAYGAAGFDLTPGLENRASCPEAIWQAARWWQRFYADRNQVVSARYFAKNDFVSEDWTSPTKAFVAVTKEGDYTAGRVFEAAKAGRKAPAAKRRTRKP